MQKLKDIIKCRTEREWNKAQDEIDVQVVVPVTKTVIDYEHSLYRKIDELKPVYRLRGVKQVGIADTCCDSALASGNRYYHSLVFATVADYFAQTKGFDRNLAVFTAMLHDAGSYVLSDSVQCGLNVDEVDKLEQVLNKHPEVEKLMDKHSVNRNDVIDAVIGRRKDPLGQLINSTNALDADRVTYTNSDASNLGVLPKTWLGPYIVNPFDDATIDNGRLVFTRIDDVAQILEARGQMFEKYYRSSEIMAKESFIAKVARQLIDRGIIKEESLLEMEDKEFRDIVCKHGGEIGRSIFQFGRFETHGMVTASEEDVSNFIGQLTKRPFGVKKLKNVNPAIETLVMVDDEIQPYKIWEPFHANWLKERLSVWGYTAVYGYERDRELHEATRKAQERFGKPKEPIPLKFAFVEKG